MAKNPSARFDARQDALFSGSLINRERPISFELEGRSYQGFEGDSILSALLASGVDTLGEMNGEEIALDAEACPPVVATLPDTIKTIPLPMERTPLVEGMQLRLFASEADLQKVKRSPVERIKRIVSGQGARSLDLELREGSALAGSWMSLPAEKNLETDLVVVGGGVGGLSAALAAAESGWAVTIIERRSILGGDARFFGAQEGEQRPGDFIKSLEDALADYDNVQVFTNSQALSLSGNSVKVHRVVRHESSVHTEMLRISSRRCVLATGTLERLPVFPGNRLPGVVKARAAFHLATFYGVWSGKNAAFCISSSAATQVALLAADMGIKVAKLADSRGRPKSRFFEFAKAYGISLATGTQAVSAKRAGGGQLNAQFGLASNSSLSNPDTLLVDRLVVCGGWQPDLTLWHGAGGESAWSVERCQLQGVGVLKNIALAGSNAGELSMYACANHGRATFFELAGLDHSGEKFTAPDLEHESDDGQLPVVQAPEGVESCFLDSGDSFVRVTTSPDRGFLARLWPRRAQPYLSKSAEDRILTLNEVAAKVVLGEIPAEYSGIIAQERCIHVGRFSDGARVLEDDRSIMEGVPNYLVGRFGDREDIVELGVSNEVTLEVGCQIYLDTETNLPSRAIGVVFKAANEGTGTNLAYMNMSAVSEGQTIIVRNNTHVEMVQVAKSAPSRIRK